MAARKKKRKKKVPKRAPKVLAAVEDASTEEGTSVEESASDLKGEEITPVQEDDKDLKASSASDQPPEPLEAIDEPDENKDDTGSPEEEDSTDNDSTEESGETLTEAEPPEAKEPVPGKVDLSPSQQDALVNEVVKQDEKIEGLNKHVGELEEDLERSRARLRTMNQDFTRFRKRTNEEAEKQRDEALGDIVNKLLPIRDNLELAVQHANAEKESLDEIPKASEVDPKHSSDAAKDESNDDTAGLQQGVGMVLKHFEQVLQGLGVKEVPSENSPFDPQVHEAMDIVIRPDLPDETVFDVLQRGYFLKDRLVRPARVRVSRKETPKPANPSNGAPLGDIEAELETPAAPAHSTSPQGTQPQTKEAPPVNEAPSSLASEDGSTEDQEIEIQFDENDSESTETAGTRKVAPHTYVIDLDEFDSLGEGEMDLSGADFGQADDDSEELGFEDEDDS